MFGAYDPIVANRTTDLNATGSITIACTKGIAPTIALGPGNNAAGATRRMAGGTGDFLVYQLYQPPGTAAGTPCSFPGARVWGGTAADLFSTSMTDNKLSRTYNVCGTIRSGQNPAVGNYSDVVVATVTF